MENKENQVYYIEYICEYGPQLVSGRIEIPDSSLENKDDYITFAKMLDKIANNLVHYGPQSITLAYQKSPNSDVICTTLTNIVQLTTNITNFNDQNSTMDNENESAHD